MACPTCSHTMYCVATDLFACARCGTIKNRAIRASRNISDEDDSDVGVYVPKLVDRAHTLLEIAMDVSTPSSDTARAEFDRACQSVRESVKKERV